MTTQLQAGQRLPLGARTQLALRLEGAPQSLEAVRSALLLYSPDEPDRPAHVLCAPGLAPPSDPIQILKAHHYTLQLDRAQPALSRILWVLWLPEAGGAPPQETLQLCIEEGGEPFARFALESPRLTQAPALIGLEFYVRADWRVCAQGAGFVGGLRALASRLNLTPFQRHLLESLPHLEGPESSEPPEGATTPGLPVHLPGAPLTPHRVPQDLLSAVARVQASDHGRPLWSGTAFALTPGGCLVTCAHVALDAPTLQVRFHGQRRARPCALVAVDEALDLALLRCLDLEGCPRWLRAARFEPGEGVELGCEVGLLGFPLGELGEEISYSQGIINSVRQREGHPIFQVDAGAAPGSSGGPLFRRSDGAVLGILGSGVSGPTLGMHANLALSLEALFALGWLSHEAL